MTGMIAKLLGSRLRAKLLGWLFSHPDEAFFIRQLQQLIAEDSTNISRELRRLEQMGIVESAKRANAKYYKTNERCPFYEELRGLFLKTTGAPGEIKEVLQDIDGIEAAFIYGSVAKGEENSGSDIDLFLIGDIDEGKLLAKLPEVERRLGREVNYSVYARDEFSRRKKQGDRFIATVLNEPKLTLVGNPDEL